MIYDATILSLGTPLNRVTAEIDDTGSIITVWLPSVISRLPVVDDHIMIQQDDAELNDYAEFVCYSTEASVDFIMHKHKLFSDQTVENMADESAKGTLAKQLTGGVLMPWDGHSSSIFD